MVRITGSCASDSVATLFLQNSSPCTVTRFFCNNVPDPQCFTVDYLTNSCGLSQQSALKVSKRLLLKSTMGPDSVLSLFNSYGFTQAQISKIVKLRPTLLLASPDKSLKPKLEYLYNVGIAGPDLTKIISTSPYILDTSLDKKIVPSINYLRSLVGTDKGVTTILNKSWWALNDAQRIMGTNIAILRDHGVPQCNITKFLLLYPQTLNRNTDLFNTRVIQLVSMGFCPSSMMFLHGVNVLVSMNKPKWDEKIAVYKSFSWSEDEVLSVFKKQPCTMSASVRRITSSLNFFLNELQWSREDIVRDPSVILFSLEKRIIPRCCVLQILHSKNLITKAGVAQGLKVSEDRFLKNYVDKYHDVESNLLKMYQSKVGAQGLLVGAEDGHSLLDKV